MKKLLLFMMVAGLLAMFAVADSDQTAQLSGQEVAILSQGQSPIQIASGEVAIASQEDAHEEKGVVLVANTEKQEGTMRLWVTDGQRTGIGKILAVVGSESILRRLAAAPPSAADGVMAISVISIV